MEFNQDSTEELSHLDMSIHLRSSNMCPLPFEEEMENLSTHSVESFSDEGERDQDDMETDHLDSCWTDADRKRKQSVLKANQLKAQQQFFKIFPFAGLSASVKPKEKG